MIILQKYDVILPRLGTTPPADGLIQRQTFRFIRDLAVSGAESSPVKHMQSDKQKHIIYANS